MLASPLVVQRPGWARPPLRMAMQTLRTGGFGQDVFVKNLEMARDVEAQLDKTLEKKLSHCVDIQAIEPELSPRRKREGETDSEVLLAMRRASALLRRDSRNLI